MAWKNEYAIKSPQVTFRLTKEEFAELKRLARAAALKPGLYAKRIVKAQIALAKPD